MLPRTRASVPWAEMLKMHKAQHPREVYTRTSFRGSHGLFRRKSKMGTRCVNRETGRTHLPNSSWWTISSRQIILNLIQTWWAAWSSSNDRTREVEISSLTITRAQIGKMISQAWRFRTLGLLIWIALLTLKTKSYSLSNSMRCTTAWSWTRTLTSSRIWTCSKRVTEDFKSYSRH